MEWAKVKPSKPGREVRIDPSEVVGLRRIRPTRRIHQPCEARQPPPSAKSRYCKSGVNGLNHFPGVRILNGTKICARPTSIVHRREISRDRFVMVAERLKTLTAIELCAGGRGQALGLEMAGFCHVAAVEFEPIYCATLAANRPQWKVITGDIRNFSPDEYSGIDLLAGGVPCPPFSIAGKQLGADDERDMFPAALRIIERIRPRAVMLENVPGLASARFKDYRNGLLTKLSKFGYSP